MGARLDPARRGHNWVPDGARERRHRADARRPERRRVHVRRRLEPDDVQELEEQGRGLGASSSTSRRTRCRPTTPTLLGMFPARVEPQQAVRGVQRRELRGRSSRPSSRAARTRRSRSGRGRERLQGPLREHPRLRGRARAASTRRRRSSSSSTRPPRKPTACSPRAPARGPVPGRARERPPPSSARCPARQLDHTRHRDRADRKLGSEPPARGAAPPRSAAQPRGFAWR